MRSPVDRLPQPAGLIFVARHPLLEKWVIQLHSLALCVEWLLEVEGARTRAVVVDMLVPLAGFLACWDMVVIHPPGDVRRPFWFQEPVTAIFHCFAMSSPVGECAH